MDRITDTALQYSQCSVVKVAVYWYGIKKKGSFLEKIQSGSLRSLSTNWLIHFTGTMLHLENESIMNSQVNTSLIMLPKSFLLFIVSHLANCENKK